ncbi:MAG: hypothetical protein MI865_13005 [Proteobacteria bacterium]|nr:hypothetical protein [Pseudomonadota bacterium]
MTAKTLASRISVISLAVLVAACSQEQAEPVAERAVGEGVTSGPGTTEGQWEFLGGE